MGEHQAWPRLEPWEGGRAIPLLGDGRTSGPARDSLLPARRTGPDRTEPSRVTRFPVRDMVEALLSEHEAAARRTALRVLEETGSRTFVFADLLYPAQLEIGNLWYAGQVSVTDEVRAAAIVAHLTETLPPTPTPSAVPSGSRCLLAVPRGEVHGLGLQMLRASLEDRGWEPHLVSCTGRLPDLAAAVADQRPRFFGLSAAMMPPAAEVQQLFAAVRSMGVPILVGGVAFLRRPDLGPELGADGLGADVRIGAVLAERLAFPQLRRRRPGSSPLAMPSAGARFGS